MPEMRMICLAPGPAGEHKAAIVSEVWYIAGQQNGQYLKNGFGFFFFTFPPVLEVTGTSP